PCVENRFASFPPYEVPSAANEKPHPMVRMGAFSCSSWLEARRCLNDALGQHGVGNLDEAGDVGALDVVDAAVFLAVGDAGVVDGLHDAVQLGIHLAGGPVQAHGVLAHFQTATGDAAGVGGLARCGEDAGFD